MPNLTVILGIVILLLLAATGCEYYSAKQYKTQAQAAQAQVAALVESNKSKDDVIGQYEVANKQIAQFAQQQKDNAEKAAADLSAANDALQQSRNKLARQEASDRTIPDCNKLLQTDISICPAHVDAMRQRASR